MYLHEQPKEVFERLVRSLSEEKNNLDLFKANLIETQKYELAREYNLIIKDIQALLEKLNIVLEKNETA